MSLKKDKLDELLTEFITQSVIQNAFYQYCLILEWGQDLIWLDWLTFNGKSTHLGLLYA